MKIFEDNADLYRDLSQAEKERFDAVARRGKQRIALKKNGPFMEVKGRKKIDRKTPTPPPKLTNKRQKTEEIVTKNKFDSLAIEDPPVTDDESEDVSQPIPPRTPASQKFHQPPPITIDNINNSAAFLKKLQEMTGQKLMRRVIGKDLRIIPQTQQACHTIRKFIDREKLESFTYQLSEEN
ncbi:hypothetical protein TNIN_260181 [Trichonephila inaurata madagascariensis]|uniref:Uncharacterized protein n=1 Tax=Trichonephila inaurata madagascariensis TaxID=2747483 RepID=A0A8X6YAT9_9ARAC|nr:hypothetical protein TNIN_260181 [Trichonephila inaurata madagascariensis]